MSLGKQILRTLVIYLLSLIVLVAIVFLPKFNYTVEVEERGNGSRTVTVVSNDDYYSFDEHLSSIKTYFTAVMEYKSLGPTRYNSTVEAEIFPAINKSITVIVVALILSAILGVLKGFFDFRMQRRKLSIFGNGTTWLFQSIPDFFIILFVQLLLIRYLPITKFFEREGWDAFVLPALLVAIFPTMYIARITSAALAGQAGQLYIQVARAKGLTERKILYKHIFRNCLGTILTHLPSLMVYLLSNLLLVEYFMNYHGAMYRLFIALDFDRSKIERYVETGMIFWICIFFMLLLFVVQLISIIAKRYYEPSKLEVDA